MINLRVRNHMPGNSMGSIWTQEDLNMFPTTFSAFKKNFPFSDINLFDFQKTLGKDISSHHIMIIIVIRIVFSLETLPIQTTSKM